jgi:hypothetical protein
MATLRISRQYRTYRYKDKNPVIDKMRTIAQEEGMYSKKQRGLLHQISGLATSTIDGWFDGETRNPQHHTIAAFITSLGYEETFQKVKTIDVDKELEAAADWILREEKRIEAAGGKKAKPKTNGHKRTT